MLRIGVLATLLLSLIDCPAGADTDPLNADILDQLADQRKLLTTKLTHAKYKDAPYRVYGARCTKLAVLVPPSLLAEGVEGSWYLVAVCHLVASVDLQRVFPLPQKINVRAQQ